MLNLEEEKVSRFRQQLDFINRELKATQNELAHQKSITDRMQKEYDQNAKSHENEVQLRMHFEERLNNLHALNRTFQDLSLENINKVNDRDQAIKAW